MIEHKMGRRSICQWHLPAATLAAPLGVNGEIDINVFLLPALLLAANLACCERTLRRGFVKYVLLLI